MASYAVAERRLATAIRDLHRYVWAGSRMEERDLIDRLLRGAKDLDRHLGTRGRVERSVRPLTRGFRRSTQGRDLFTFLQAVAGLSYAAERVRRQPREAARAASELAVSLSVRLADVSGAADLADRFESGRADFAEFSAKLEGRMEGRGVLRAAEFARATNLAFDIHALWDRKSPAKTRRVVAEVGVAAAGFACVVFVDALRSLGRYRDPPYGRLVPVVSAILEGLGGQA